MFSDITTRSKNNYSNCTVSGGKIIQVLTSVGPHNVVIEIQDEIYDNVYGPVVGYSVFQTQSVYKVLDQIVVPHHQAEEITVKQH